MEVRWLLNIMDRNHCFRRYILVFFAIIICVQGLMFPPSEGRSCSDNMDCISGCCLMTGTRHSRPQGICQPFKQLDEYCAPGDRLRNMFGSRVYTHSCPCISGLICKPSWRQQAYGMTFIQDPKCTPRDLPPYATYLKEYVVDNDRRYQHKLDYVPKQ